MAITCGQRLCTAGAAFDRFEIKTLPSCACLNEKQDAILHNIETVSRECLSGVDERIFVRMNDILLAKAEIIERTLARVEAAYANPCG